MFIPLYLSFLMLFSSYRKSKEQIPNIVFHSSTACFFVYSSVVRRNSCRSSYWFLRINCETNI